MVELIRGEKVATSCLRFRIEKARAARKRIRFPDEDR